MDEDLTKHVEPLSVYHRIFLGKQGIRAGWSIGIFLILMIAITFTFNALTLFLFSKINLPENNTQPIQSCASEFTWFLGLLGASMYMAFLEHKPLISYGLEGTQRIKKFLYGVLSGAVSLSVLIGVLKLCGLLIFDGQNIYGSDVIQYAFGWGLAFFFTGLSEEYFLRGYLQATLTRGIGFWWSASILSIAFGSLHLLNKGESPVGICSAALAGLVFCISLWYLKNLWWAIGFHASWDWAQSYLWGTADSGRVVQGHLFSVHPEGNILWSGGATGPEGSLFVIPLLLVIAFLMWIMWGKTIKHYMNGFGHYKKSPGMIYHIVEEKDYRSQNDGKKYLPSNFHDHGFVHCAQESSVLPVANDYYALVEEKLLLLRIDPSKLESQTRFEAASPEKGVSTLHTASSPVFPHVYGAINNSAIDGIGVLMKGKGGYTWPKEFLSIGEYFDKDSIITA